MSEELLTLLENQMIMNENQITHNANCNKINQELINQIVELTHIVGDLRLVMENILDE